MSDPVRVPIVSQADAERARRDARHLAHALDFGTEDAEAVVLSTMELATNLLRYAVSGEICLQIIEGPQGRGIRVESHDLGPGIPDVPRALEEGFSTGGGLGGGLPGVRRLMDTFEIHSGPTGTRVIACKWPSSR